MLREILELGRIIKRLIVYIHLWTNAYFNPSKVK